MPFFILGPRQFLARRRQQVRKVAGSDRPGAQVLNGVPALGDCLLRSGDRGIENLNGFFGPQVYLALNYKPDSRRSNVAYRSSLSPASVTFRCR